MKDKTLAVLCHAGGFIGSFILPFLGGVITPLVIWATGKSPEKPLLTQHGKEAVNFQISMLLYAIIVTTILFGGAILFGLAPLVSDDSNMVAAFIGSGAVIAFCMIVFGLMWLLEAICVIIAIAKAATEQDYRYPFTIRFVK